MYNLLDEGWIPALYKDGRYDRVGVRKALREAHLIRQVGSGSPLDRLAIIRFLLAVLYWCQGSPPSNGEAEAEHPFPDDWFKKLDERKECFNLLGEGKRFYQNEAYRAVPPEHTANYLIQEVPTGTNKWHFRHSTDKNDGLCPACCALGLIRSPVFATSGGKGMSPESGKSQGINGKPPLYVVRVGNSLAETLRFSWEHRPDLDLGVPGWEKADIQLPKQGVVPLLIGLTWIPRNVWLSHPEDPGSTCISCGLKGPVIRRCVFDGKGSAKREGRDWKDPHVVYEKRKEGNVVPLQVRDSLRASDAAAGQWTYPLVSILKALEEGKNISPRQIWLVGFSSVDNDKYVEAVECTIAFPNVHQVDDAVQRLERWRKLGNDASKKLSQLRVQRPAIMSTIRADVETQAFAKVAELITGNETARNTLISAYASMLKAASSSLAVGFTSAAVQLRRTICHITSDLGVSSKHQESRGKRKETK